MATDQQIEANRRNSQLSTGPISPAGRDRSSQNATKHGYTGKTLVLTEAEREPYAAHVVSFTTKYAPVDGVESTLCYQLAEIHRTLHQISVDISNMNTLLTEATAEQRAAGTGALATLTALAPHVRTLNTLNLYDQRRRRAANDVEQRLLTMQAERLKAAKDALHTAARHSQVHRMKGLPWNPAENGFVHSQEEIDAYVRRANIDADANLLARLNQNPYDPRLKDFKASLKIQPRQL